MKQMPKRRRTEEGLLLCPSPTPRRLRVRRTRKPTAKSRLLKTLRARRKELKTDLRSVERDIRSLVPRRRRRRRV